MAGPLVPGAVEEGLRSESPVQFWLRRALVDVTVCGVTIPAGDKVVVSLGGAFPSQATALSRAAL